MKIWRWPLLHFLLLGGLLYAVQLPSTPLRERDPALSEVEMRSLSAVEGADEAILLREALRLGLDETDRVVRRRLLMNMRFAFPESQDDDAALLLQARRLGMNTRDVVVRRRLVLLMQQQLVGEVRLSERELREYIAQHYKQPERRAFRHVYFSDANPEAAVASALLKLSGKPEAASVTGDAFLPGESFSLRSAAEIARDFGPAFAAALMQAPLQQWSGPVRSTYGVHLVYVARSEREAPADFAAVRGQAAWALRNERERQALRQALQEMKS